MDIAALLPKDRLQVTASEAERWTKNGGAPVVVPIEAPDGEVNR